MQYLASSATISTNYNLLDSTVWYRTIAALRHKYTPMYCPLLVAALMYVLELKLPDQIVKWDSGVTWDGLCHRWILLLSFTINTIS